MEKEKNNHHTKTSSVQGKQDQKKEECPHCKISEETLERLKKAGKEKKTEQNPEDKDES